MDKLNKDSLNEEIINLKDFISAFGYWTQEEVEYVDPAPEFAALQERSCSTCELYQQGNSCYLVEGDISPQAYCKLWTQLQEGTESEAEDNEELSEFAELPVELKTEEELAYAMATLQDKETSEEDFNKLLQEYAEELEEIQNLSSKVSMRSEHKNPEGGLSSKGRSYYNKKTGSNLKPGVKGNPKSLEDLRRKGSFLTRFYGQAKLPPFKKPNGEPSRFSLAAVAWGEPAPTSVSAARRLAAKGRNLLSRYEAAKQKNKKKSNSSQKMSISLSPELAIQQLSNGMIKVPIAMKGKFKHDAYGEVSFDDKDITDIMQNFSDKVLGFEPYATYGHLVDPEIESIDAELKKGSAREFVIEDDVLFVITEPTPETFDLVARGEYDYASGEFIRNYKDKVTGENKGTVLMRYALTNSPFLPFNENKIELLSQNSDSDCSQSTVSFVIKLSKDSTSEINNLSNSNIHMDKDLNPSQAENATPQTTAPEVVAEVTTPVAVEAVKEASVVAPATPAAVVETAPSAPVTTPQVSVDVSQLINQVATQTAESLKTQYQAVIEGLNQKIAGLENQLTAQQTATQLFSNSLTAQKKQQHYDYLASKGVSPVLIQRFSQVENALESNSKVIKLSTQAGEVEKTIVEEISSLLIDAVNTDPVVIEQFGQTVSVANASGLSADLKRLVETNRESAKKVSLG